MSGIAKEEKVAVKATSHFFKQRRRGLSSRNDLEQKRRSRSVHSYSNEERVAFTAHLNKIFAKDESVKDIFPLDPNTDEIFDHLAKGVLLCKWLEKIQPGVVGNYNKNPKNRFEQIENHNAALAAVRELGIQIVNTGANDLEEKKVHIVLGLMWQTMRAELLMGVKHDTEEMSKFLDEKKPTKDLSLENMLLMWFNNILQRASEGEDIVKNFDVDLMDSRAYILVLNEIAPKQCNLDPLDEENLDTRAGLMLQEASKIVECKGYILPEHVSMGNTKLNITFMSMLFHKHAELERERDNKEVEDEPPKEVKVEEPVAPAQALSAKAYIGILALALAVLLVIIIEAMS
eukprot:TRINITY_DN7964_c0_g1_i1.p1 TRINITY_DN7964_c0_g1~~TRINITY_DN7964_c0_g1_i1.p1  ORF type:complete len:346 (-),score=57.89 TRINITY_DN7964_c0_g1_i1:136-1173(-)